MRGPSLPCCATRFAVGVSPAPWFPATAWGCTVLGGLGGAGGFRHFTPSPLHHDGCGGSRSLPGHRFTGGCGLRHLHGILHEGAQVRVLPQYLHGECGQCGRRRLKHRGTKAGSDSRLHRGAFRLHFHFHSLSRWSGSTGGVQGALLSRLSTRARVRGPRQDQRRLQGDESGGRCSLQCPPAPADVSLRRMSFPR